MRQLSSIINTARKFKIVPRPPVTIREIPRSLSIMRKKAQTKTPTFTVKEEAKVTEQQERATLQSDIEFMKSNVRTTLKTLENIINQQKRTQATLDTPKIAKRATNKAHTVTEAQIKQEQTDLERSKQQVDSLQLNLILFLERTVKKVSAISTRDEVKG